MKRTKGLVLLVLILGLGYNVARAESFRGWEPPIECGQALGVGSQEGLLCLRYSLDEAVTDYAAHLIERQGQALVGENFRFVHRLSWSPTSSAGPTRNLDAVFPLNFASSAGGAGLGWTALFLQQGITRWQDNAGLNRNDIRQGVTYRFVPPDSTSILGFSALYQENLERKHRRTVMSLDYAGRYGNGRIQHYVPASGWVQGRPGHEERPLGGTEISASLGITSTLSLDTALSRWNDAKRDLHGRVNLGLRPHPWLSFRAGLESGFEGDATNVHVQLTMPLGGVPKPVPRWEGLGVLGVASSSTSDIWRPVGNVEQLRTVERVISPAATVNSLEGGLPPIGGEHHRLLSVLEERT